MKGRKMQVDSVHHKCDACLGNQAQKVFASCEYKAEQKRQTCVESVCHLFGPPA